MSLDEHQSLHLIQDAFPFAGSCLCDESFALAKSELSCAQNSLCWFNLILLGIGLILLGTAEWKTNNNTVVEIKMVLTRNDLGKTGVLSISIRSGSRQ